jgi:hypothetical protein
MKKTSIIFSSLLVSVSLSVKAQSASLSGGGEANGTSGSVSYSIGQLVYTSVSNTNGSVCQGVQQTYKISSAGLLISDIDFSLSVFPNPTTNLITLDVGKYSNLGLNYVLIDGAGKQIQTSKIIDKQTNIDMNKLPTATYMVEVYQEKKKVQSFKILKIN